MKPQRWRERLLASTRGQILAFLRTEARTVNELAALLKLTDNAVRAHLVSLERDGLIQRHGSRRGIRKPHISYGLSADAEQIFPKAYGSLLNHFVASISRRLDRRELRASMREVGLSLANEQTDGLSERSRKERLATALDLLKKLGGEATYHADRKKFIRSNHCPIAAITADYPDACLIVETFLSRIIGTRVKQRCEQGIPPRCCFELAGKK